MNDTLSCGCLIDEHQLLISCEDHSSTPPRPTTEESRTCNIDDAGQPCGKHFEKKIGCPVHGYEADHRGHRILVNGHSNRRCHDCEEWVFYDPAPRPTEEGRPDYREDWARRWADFVEAVHDSAILSQLDRNDIIDKAHAAALACAALAAPPSDQEEPHDLLHKADCPLLAAGIEHDGYCPTDPQWRIRAASTPVPALDVERLAATEWVYDTMPESFDVVGDPVEVWTDRHYPATEHDKERYRRRAAAILRRLSGDEGGAG